MEAFLQNPTCTAHGQEWDGTSKELAPEAREEGVGRDRKKMEKKEQEREEQFGGSRETEQRAETGKEQERRRAGLAQASGGDAAQLVPELVGREGKARRRGRGFAPVLGSGKVLEGGV